MKNSSKILILTIVFGVLCEFRVFSSEKDLATCTFYYWRVDWHTAMEQCRKEGRRLLCYGGRRHMEDITEAFRLSASDAALDIWMANRNCSSGREVECLSLHIAKSGVRVWHYFQEDCSESFPFICCVRTAGSSTTTASSTSEAEPSSVSAQVVSSTPLPSTEVPRSSCRRTWIRGIWWPETEAGDTARHPCPGNSTGSVYLRCREIHGHAIWSERGPNFRECRSNNIAVLKEKFNTSSIAEIMKMLEGVFLHPSEAELFGEDLAQVVSLVTGLPGKVRSETSGLPAPERWTATRDYVDQSAGIFDRVLGLNNSWMDMEHQRRNEVGTKLFTTIDQMGILLADAMTDDAQEPSIERKNLVLQVARSRPGQALRLPQGEAGGGGSSILLEEGFDADLHPQRGNVSVVFVLYYDLRRILSSDQNASSAAGELNSAVVSATVAQESEPVDLQGSLVKILVEHLTPRPNQTACVFWNVKYNAWDTEGCRLELGNESHSLCVCDHLTNFAVLMDYRGVLEQVDQTLFNYITLVGCALSVVCLALCVVVFSCYSYHSKHSWGLRYVIHRNLCLTLLVANLFMIFGLDETENPSVCAAVAGALHFFFLSAFSWMLLEGVHIYLLLVVVFASRRSHWEKYYLFGYGFPMIVVAITAIVRPTYYGTEEVCWLSTEKGTIWAFMGPVAVILIMNTAALLLAQWKASRVSGKDDNSVMFKRWLRVTFILFPVLGITWVLGFLFVGRHFQVASYLFAVLNSLQGLCIFVCHCLMDKKARTMVITSIRKKTASVNTGSSSGQRNKPRPSAQKAASEDACRRHWRRWHRPWRFCVDLPVSEAPQEPPPQWHGMQDKAV